MLEHSFASMMQRYHDLTALDFYLAKSLLTPLHEELEDACWQRCLHYIMALSWAQRHGNSCLPIAEIAEQLWWHDLATDKSGYQFACLDTVKQDLMLLIERFSSPAPLVLAEQQLYSARYYQFEADIQQRLSALQAHLPCADEMVQRLRVVWPLLFPASVNKPQIDWQQVAVALAVQQQLLILSGGPGTGKTYTVARILAALQLTQQEGIRIGLAAPTGKAAQRLSESLQQSFNVLAQAPELAPTLSKINTSAITVHRLLGLRESTVATKFDKETPLPLDVLVVDESSMLDVAIFARLLRAIPDHCRLILVGDAHQLPAVESGNVLPTIMPRLTNELAPVQAEWLNAFLPSAMQFKGTAARLLSAVQLTETHRFSGALSAFAKKVLASKQDPVKAVTTYQYIVQQSKVPTSSLHWVERSRLASSIQQWVRDFYLPIAHETSDPVNALQLASKFRLLCCVRQGPDGVDMLNEAIEQVLKRALGIPMEQRHFHGQLLMVTQNIPSVGLFNGDVGVVWDSAQEGTRIAFQNTGQATIRFLDLYRIAAIERVFAMTVHKSQGSEFEHVGLLLPRMGGHELLSNALIYTAVTRAKTSLHLFSDEEQFIEVIQRSGERWSGLQSI